MKTVTKQCAVCGVDFNVPVYRAHTAKYCNIACQRAGLKGQPNVTCPICGTAFHVKPYHLKRFSQVCCSKECGLILRKIKMSGTNNHQYGLRGKLNASFKNEATIHDNNGNTDFFIYVEGHPRPSNRNGRILLHRYLVEINHDKFDDRYFEERNGWIVLKHGIEVHHIDGNHQNNNINNLMPVTKAEHRSIHNSEQATVRSVVNGQIESVSKFDKKVRIKLIDGGELPCIMTAGAGGADLKAIADYEILPGERVLIKTGVCTEIPSGYLAFVMGRSGNTIKRGLHIALGLIDSDYRGEIGALAFNLSSDTIQIQKGDRIAQMIILPYPHIEFEESDELTETDRGVGGYGSTN